MNIGAVFSYKMKRGLAGRRQSLKIVQKAFAESDEVIWMHAASLGEYEQGLPVLEQLKQSFPHYKVLVTFFSPSGYENVIGKKTIADALCYLPFDEKSLLEQFTSQFKTRIFFTVKYEYWYQLLAHLKLQGAKVYVISALFYENQVFFKSYGGFFRRELRINIDWFFHQTKNSYALAKTIQLHKSSISGDTRFDRVKQIQNRDNTVPYISEFKKDNLLVVFGSAWDVEERIAARLRKKNADCKIIIAPHDVSRALKMRQKFPNALLYSELLEQPSALERHSVLIIDSIGLLSKLYAYADVAIVGGGFHSAGLHNILEAATFGIPVLFGNQYQKNPEADALISAKGGKSFDNDHQAAEFLLSLVHPSSTQNRLKMGAQAGKFIANQPISSAIIVKKIAEDHDDFIS